MAGVACPTCFGRDLTNRACPMCGRSGPDFCPHCGGKGRATPKDCGLHTWHFQHGDSRLDFPHAPTCVCASCETAKKENTMPERNTTVTLDLGGRDVEEVIGLFTDAAKDFTEGSDFFAWVRDEVKRQCPPVLEIGWHVVTDHRRPGLRVARYWVDGEWHDTECGDGPGPHYSPSIYVSQRFLAGPAYPAFD